MEVNVQIIFYSQFGHIFKLAQAIAEGVKNIDGARVSLFQIPALVSNDKMDQEILTARAAFEDIPIANVAQLPEADAIIFGTPTRYGNMCSEMKNFIDQTGDLWGSGSLIGKIGSVFASTGSQHGGQETTITSFHTILFHLGFIVVGVPYSEPGLTLMSEVSGGTPYGATTLSGPDNKRAVSENELRIARFQGRHVAAIAKKLKIGSA